MKLKINTDGMSEISETKIKEMLNKYKLNPDEFEDINLPLNITTSDEESTIIKEYHSFLNEEHQKEQENSKCVLSEI